MAPVACPKCSVVAYQTASGGWRFDPPTGCVDLQGTEWGAKGEFEWCPTLAVAMPDEVFWPGQSQRDHVMRVAEQAQGGAKEKAGSSKKIPRLSDQEFSFFNAAYKARTAATLSHRSTQCARIGLEENSSFHRQPPSDIRSPGRRGLCVPRTPSLIMTEIA